MPWMQAWETFLQHRPLPGPLSQVTARQASSSFSTQSACPAPWRTADCGAGAPAGGCSYPGGRKQLHSHLEGPEQRCLQRLTRSTHRAACAAAWSVSSRLPSCKQMSRRVVRCPMSTTGLQSCADSWNSAWWQPLLSTYHAGGFHMHCISSMRNPRWSDSHGPLTNEEN